MQSLEMGMPASGLLGRLKGRSSFPLPPRGSHIIVYLLEVEKEGNLLKLWLLDFFLEVYPHITCVCMYLCVFVCVCSFIALLRMSHMVSPPEDFCLTLNAISPRTAPRQKPSLILCSLQYLPQTWLSMKSEVQNLKIKEIYE